MCCIPCLFDPKIGLSLFLNLLQKKNLLNNQILQFSHFFIALAQYIFIIFPIFYLYSYFSYFFICLLLLKFFPIHVTFTLTSISLPINFFTPFFFWNSFNVLRPDFNFAQIFESNQYYNKLSFFKFYFRFFLECGVILRTIF